MLTRQLVLLLVGAMHFVAVRATITKKGSPNVHIINNFDGGGTIYQMPMYGLLESVLDAKWRYSPKSVADVTLTPWSSQFWPPSTLVRLENCSESEFSTTD